jgi:DNA (cytosine-5)-methyltransferase 1
LGRELLNCTVRTLTQHTMAAYYNEIDPYAAQWLRNLIAAGHIAPGDVDERSIVDVRAADLCGYEQCHFFAGIGGWSYALRLAGWPDNQPVWTGSCPCQPLSSAGHRKGHADERHLWPAFYRLISECAPAIVFGEQVASKDGREWFAGVRADLEALGYACGAADLCAAGVGAPHVRQRLYWLADANGWNASEKWEQPRWQHGQLPKDDVHSSRIPDPQGSQARPKKSENGSGEIGFGWPNRSSPDRRFVDADCFIYRIPEPFIPFVAYGVPGILDQISAAGNAIVPQVAAEFIQAATA